MTIVSAVFDLVDGKHPPQKWSITVHVKENELVFITMAGAVLEVLLHWNRFLKKTYNRVTVNRESCLIIDLKSLENKSLRTSVNIIDATEKHASPQLTGV